MREIAHEHGRIAKRMSRGETSGWENDHPWVESGAVDTSLSGLSGIIRHGIFMWKPKPENSLAALTLRK